MATMIDDDYLAGLIQELEAEGERIDELIEALEPSWQKTTGNVLDENRREEDEYLKELLGRVRDEDI